MSEKQSPSYFYQDNLESVRLTTRFLTSDEWN
jgi:hypothetical protein